jgi:hypothetical protein
VTPSGIKFQDLKIDDLVLIRELEPYGENGVRPVVVSPKKNKPTSEASLYYDALVEKFLELSYGALLHGHDRAITDARENLMRIYDNVRATDFNGDYGTQEFSNAVNGAAVGGHGTCGVIAPFHDAPTGGFFSYGKTLQDSLAFTREVHRKAL